jgi:hypothetical protein
MARKSKRNASKAKKPTQQKKQRQKPKQRRRRAGGAGGLSNPSNPTFGAVSTINTAPVAIGNSMRGMKTQVFHTANGCRVVGRDFGLTAFNSGTVTNWCLVGGIPITPMCLPSSTLRQIALMYSQFKLRSLIIHYITSSSTSSTGDIMFYVRRNEGSVLPGPTSSVFLPYVLSDEYTIIGPQWTNHTATLTPTLNWLSCDYGATANLELYNDRDIFLYSKTASGSDSPGYVILDFDYEFRELAINPRAGQISSIAGASAQWTQAALSFTGAKTTGSTVLEVAAFGTTGVGGTTISAFSPIAGAVYEVILDVTNSTFSTTTAANFINWQFNAQTSLGYPITDGTVMYYAHENSHGRLYQNIESAVTSSNPGQAGASVTYAELIQVWVKIVFIGPNSNYTEFAQ